MCELSIVRTIVLVCVLVVKFGTSLISFTIVFVACGSGDPPRRTKLCERARRAESDRCVTPALTYLEIYIFCTLFLVRRFGFNRDKNVFEVFKNLYFKKVLGHAVLEIFF